MRAPCPDPFNLAAYVLAAAERTPDRIALLIVSPAGAERWSYRALAGAVRGIGTGLLAAGLDPGDRVMLRLGNTVDFPLAFLGAIAAGIVPIPTSSQLTAPEITAMAAQVAPAAVIAAPGIALPDHPAPVIAASTLAGWRGLAPCDWAMGPADRLGYMVFTSGTSGRPRAVMHAHRAVWARRMMWDGWYGLTPDDRLMHAGAFNWTYTLGTGLMDPWAIGATALIPALGTETGQIGLLMKRHDATIFAAAPGVYRQLLRFPLPPLPKLRHGLSAGEALPAATRAAWVAATGRPILEALGMSEVSTFISAPPGRAVPPGATGWPQPGRRVGVLRPDGTPAGPDEAGELCVAADDPGLFLGYWGAPDETAARFCDGWFRTGDMVAQGADGAIRYLGRADDLMNAGGYRVAPAEVERAFDDLPGLAECAATAVEVRPGVEVIALFYRPTVETLSEAVLAAHAEARLARYKQPRLFVPLAELPRGANAKLNRRALRALWQERGVKQ
jgi:acyl-coenzyme A synthetase/AMP-(fatty) acid ligase